MKRNLRTAIVLLVMLMCTGCDQAVKGVARQALEDKPPVPVLNDLIRFEYFENPGATLGFGAALSPEARRVIFIGAIGLVCLAILAFALGSKSLSLPQAAGLALIAAGGFGNVIDRVVNDGVVIDFVSFGIGSLRTGVMNLADIAIFAGLVLLFIASNVREASAGRGAAS